MTAYLNGNVPAAGEAQVWTPSGEPPGTAVVPAETVEMPPPTVLFRSAEPDEIVREASAVARALAPVIDGQRLFTDINGRRHVRVEGWTLLGSMLGVFPVCVWSRPLAPDLTSEQPSPVGWEARVEARTLSGALVGAAEACCTRDEPNWRDKPDYALRSMAQTRATSKALRLPLGFVVALAGYEATPAEELDGVSFRGQPAPHPPARPAQRPPAPREDSRPPMPATEAQLRAIHAIARSTRGMEPEQVEAACQRRYGVPPAGLSRRQASELIDLLKERPRG